MTTADTNVTALVERLEALERAHADLTTHNSHHGPVDTFWLLFCAALINFMQVGFAMLETGSVRHKNTMNILIKNLLDVCSGAIAWFAFGSSIARDGDGAVFGAARRSIFNVVEMHEDAVDDPDGYLLASWAFQFVFVATATTIVSGAMAERTQILAYLCLSFLTSGLIYPVVARWVWCSKGWLSVANPNAFLGGMLDFAGSGVVHLTGGFMSLCGAAIVGPRRGRFDEYRRALPMPGHNPALQVLGTFFLWIGWYGFNAGSTMRISSPHMSRVAARAVLTTTLSAVGGGLACCFGNKLLGSRTWSVTAVCNGLLAGLVSVTASCAVIQPAHAIAIGAVGGLLYLAVSHLTLHVLRVDDPVDAFAVHGAGGLWGLVACALFASPEYVGSIGVAHHGAFYGGDAQLLGAAAVGALAIVAWVCGVSSLIFLAVKALGVLRVDVQSELVGLDVMEHGRILMAESSKDASRHSKLGSLDASRHRSHADGPQEVHFGGAPPPQPAHQTSGTRGFAAAAAARSLLAGAEAGEARRRAQTPEPPGGIAMSSGAATASASSSGDGGAGIGATTTAATSNALFRGPSWEPLIQPHLSGGGRPTTRIAAKAAVVAKAASVHGGESCSRLLLDSPTLKPSASTSSKASPSPSRRSYARLDGASSAEGGGGGGNTIYGRPPRSGNTSGGSSTKGGTAFAMSSSGGSGAALATLAARVIPHGATVHGATNFAEPMPPQHSPMHKVARVADCAPPNAI